MQLSKSQTCVARGDGRDRTADLLLAKQALSQLSYIPYAFRSPLGDPFGKVPRRRDIPYVSRSPKVIHIGESLLGHPLIFWTR